MNLTEAGKAFLMLIRTGLWEQPEEGLASLHLSAPQWKEVLATAKAQTLSGLLWSGLDMAADQGADVPFALMANLASSVDKCERHYESMEAAGKELFRQYESRGLHPVLLKGQSVARLYGQPQLRESGDIDVYFSEEEFTQAIPEGLARKADGSYAFTFRGETIELHDHVLDIEQPGAKRKGRSILAGQGFDESGELRTTRPAGTLLLLNAHILKHAIGMGVGLRQICDYAKAHVAYEGELQTYEADAEALGISRWTEVLDCFCHEYLGMPCGKVFSPRTRRLTSRLLGAVLKGGNFGFESRGGSGMWNTLRAFLKNMGFSMKLNASETVWTFISLAVGRLRR